MAATEIRLPSGRDFMTVVNATPRPKFYIENIIPAERSISILAGRAGVGKTILGMQAVYSVATGTPFLGYPTTSAVSGYVTFEGSEWDTAARLTKLENVFPSAGDNVHVGVLDPLKLPGRENELVAQLTGLEFVVLDSLQYMVAGSMSKGSDISAFYDSLRTVMKRAGVKAALLIHHVRKTKHNELRWEAGDLDRVRGASEIFERATTQMVLEREDVPRKLRFKGVHASADIRELHFPKHRVSTIPLMPLRLILNPSTLTFQNSTAKGE